MSVERVRTDTGIPAWRGKEEEFEYVPMSPALVMFGTSFTLMYSL